MTSSERKHREAAKQHAEEQALRRGQFVDVEFRDRDGQGSEIHTGKVISEKKSMVEIMLVTMNGVIFTCKRKHTGWFAAQGKGFYSFDVREQPPSRTMNVHRVTRIDVKHYVEPTP